MPAFKNSRLDIMNKSQNIKQFKYQLSFRQWIRVHLHVGWLTLVIETERYVDRIQENIRHLLTEINIYWLENLQNIQFKTIFFSEK